MIVVIVNVNSHNLLYIVMGVMTARISAVTTNNSDRSLLHGVCHVGEMDKYPSD